MQTLKKNSKDFNSSILLKPPARKGDMWLSKSQLESYMRCPRLWWTEKTIKIASIPNPAQAFGTVFHSVLERYLLSDVLDRDISGEPAELYPLDWDLASDKFNKNVPDVRVSPVEAALIKQLVEELIVKGHIVKDDDMLIEQEFYVPIADGIYLMGFMDILTPGRIEDHKTTSNLRYALNSETLRKDLGALVYALAYFMMFPNDESVVVKYNYALKNPDKPTIKIVETVITQDIVQEFIYELESHIPKMLEIKKVKAFDKWKEVKGPDDGDACMKYGGCAMIPVCHRGVQPKRFFMQQQDAAVRAVVSMAPKAIRFVEVKTPPWFVPGCRSCKDNQIPGFSRKGTPCKQCDHHIAYSSKFYTIKRDPEKILITSTELRVSQVILLEQKPVKSLSSSVFGNIKKRKIKKPAEDESVELMEEEEETAPKKNPLLGKKKKKKKVIRKTETDIEDEGEDDLDELEDMLGQVEEQAEKKKVRISKPTSKIQAGDLGEIKKKKIGRPKGTLTKNAITLCINCAPTNAKKTERVEKIFNKHAEELAKDKGFNSYFEMNAFERRDFMSAAVPAILDEYAGYTLVCLTDSPDLNSFRDVIAGHCTNTFQGL